MLLFQSGLLAGDKNMGIIKLNIVAFGLVEDYTSSLYETPKKSPYDEIEYLESKRKRDRKVIIFQRWFVALSVFSILLLVIFLFTNLKSKRKVRALNRALALKNNKLEELNRNKNKYLSIVSHDLRGPLGSIKALLEMYIDENKTLDKNQQMVLLSEVNNTNDLLDDLLNWSRLQFNKQGIKPETIPLAPLVIDMIETHRSRIDKKKQEIKLDISNNITVYVDSNMLKTILRNIVSNAIKFTPNGGRISLSAKLKDNNYTKITIADSGVGMNEDQLSKAFKPGKVNSTPGTENEKGTGLGLILCKEFAELNGGTINIKSQRGLGTTVTIKLSSGNSIKEA